MEKLSLTQILIKDAKLQVVKLTENVAFTKLIDETRKKQEEILKLKQVNQESLRLVVQL
ncbi:hypothetical protein [Flavobacterium psychrophilum]|uniref:hypothetical protein n=1 Tax=Flavobacterium psychrophilum TaxID=96345 RepID=UPI001D08E1F0|nr:hypothetical protein [Flavobacterium psychrophilum]MCB5984128.1 hypothetical protein [Flavobacterium psychrophilum]MCB6004406.1 hypothetical protein [Flavobacterium psychrophilum]MCB6026750.1 hypothetical protein [Flavobacterium psychrophilum]MCB6073580.1 hypothetical protein [Flavobacterium psychrophilum]MCB6105703.1 hypothetical protein [Flavobacterium psychrophilum]